MMNLLMYLFFAFLLIGSNLQSLNNNYLNDTKYAEEEIIIESISFFRVTPPPHSYNCPKDYEEIYYLITLANNYTLIIESKLLHSKISNDPINPGSLIKILKLEEEKWMLQFEDSNADSIIFHRPHPEGLFLPLDLQSDLVETFKLMKINEVYEMRRGLDIFLGIFRITLDDGDMWMISKNEINSWDYEVKEGNNIILGLSKSGSDNFWIMVDKLEYEKRPFYFDLEGETYRKDHYYRRTGDDSKKEHYSHEAYWLLPW